MIVPHGCLRREAQQRKWLKKKLGNLLLFNRFIRGAVAIQCLSELELAETKFPGRKFVGTNGIAIPDVCKKGFQKQGIQIAFIGRLEVRVKGLDLLMEALRMKADYLRQAHCRMTICGPDHAGGKWELEELIRKYALEDIVSLQNAVSGPEKEGVLLEQDIFLLTSRHEGMPLGVLEAMSYGLPCILTEGTNLRGFVEENNAGWGAENTAESIAEAILRAVNERDLWQEKSANARAAVRQAFDWDVVAERTVEVYRSLVKE